MLKIVALAGFAQWLQHWPRDVRVTGSIPDHGEMQVVSLSSLEATLGTSMDTGSQGQWEQSCQWLFSGRGARTPVDAQGHHHRTC